MKGLSVIFSAIVEKIAGFLLVLISTHFLTKETYGLVVYANTSLVFLFPFIGFGIHQSLLRFGSLEKSQKAKKELFSYTFKKGVFYSFLFIFLVVVLSPLITSNLKDSKIYLIILSIQLVSLFMYEMIRIYSRLIHLNNLYSQITIVNSIAIVFVSYFFTFNFNAIGYVVSLSLVPFLVSLFYLIKLKLIISRNDNFSEIDLNEILKYGFFTSLAGLLSQLLYAVDILLIANMIVDKQEIAQYKISNIIPFSILFLSVAVIKTNFVKIVSKSEKNKNYIKSYYINYLKVFGIVSLVILILIPLFSNQLLAIFGRDYINDDHLISIFTFGVVGAILLRIPLGNIISAIGWAKINVFNSLLILFLNIILSYVFIKEYGLIGAALVTSFLMWLSGGFSLVTFIWFLKQDTDK